MPGFIGTLRMKIIFISFEYLRLMSEINKNIYSFIGPPGIKGDVGLHGDQGAQGNCIKTSLNY